jgi:hypothetical protein
MSSNTFEDQVTYEEKIRWLLANRSYYLNKSGSVSHRFEEAQRDTIKSVHETQAALLKEKLIDTIVTQYPDRRPAPLPVIEHNGVRMVIQRYDGVTCIYVAEDKFDENAYHYSSPDYRDHIAAEISRH